MGLKTIKAKYKEDRQQFDSTVGGFVHQAQQINAKLVEYKTKLEACNKAEMEVGHAVEKAWKGATGLQTGGIVQLDDVKKLLVLAAEHYHQPHPIKPDEIAALEKNPHAKEQLFGAFVKQAKIINAELAQYKQKFDAMRHASAEVGDLVEKIHEETAALKTHGIVQLDEFKKLLILASQHPHQPHPVNLSEIQGLAQSMHEEIERRMNRMMEEYIAKKAASWPGKEIKAGMVFRHKTSHELLEITSPAQLVAGKPNDTFYKVNVLKAAGWNLDPKSTTIKHTDLSPTKGWLALKF